MVNRLLMFVVVVLLLCSCKSKKVVSAATFDSVSADSVKTESATTFIDSLVSNCDLNIDSVMITIIHDSPDSAVRHIQKVNLKGITLSKRGSIVSVRDSEHHSVANRREETHQTDSLESRTKPNSVSFGWLILLSAIVLLLLTLLYRRLHK